MRRREFAKLVAATVVWPITVSAQKPMPVIGFLSSEGSDALAPRLAAFREGLSQTGY